MKKVKRYFFSIGLFFALFFLTFFYIFKQYSFQDFLNTLASCNKWFIFCSFAMVAVYLFLGSLFTRKLFQSFGVYISRFQSLCYNCIEIYFSAVTPSSTGGQPVEAYYMAKDCIPYRKSTIVIFLNTILYKLAIVFLGIIGMICFPKLIFQHGFLFTTLMLLGLFINVFVIFFFTCLIYSKKLPTKMIHLGIRILSFLHLLSKEQKERKLNEITEVMNDYHACSEFTKKHPNIIIRSFFILLAQRISLFLVSIFIYKSFGLSNQSLLAIFFLQVAITQATDCVPFPGGVMAGESLTYQVNTLIYGSTFACSSMLLLRGISFYSLVLISSILFVIYHFITLRKEEKTI